MLMIKKQPKKNGFTLIELLVVIAILAVLSGIGLSSFINAQLKSRDARRKADLKSVSQALEAYLNDHQQYPLGSGGKIVGCDVAGTYPSSCSWGNIFKDNKDTTYMVQLPQDPSKNQSYYYESDGSQYVLYARLENDKDSAAAHNGSQAQVYQLLLGTGDTNCGAGVCNYALTSSNVPSLNQRDPT